jgi:hypothetical protein
MAEEDVWNRGEIPQPRPPETLVFPGGVQTQAHWVTLDDEPLTDALRLNLANAPGATGVITFHGTARTTARLDQVRLGDRAFAVLASYDPYARPPVDTRDLPADQRRVADAFYKAQVGRWTKLLVREV